MNDCIDLKMKDNLMHKNKMNKWLNDWLNYSMTQWLNWLNDSMTSWIIENEWMNKWINE